MHSRHVTSGSDLERVAALTEPNRRRVYERLSQESEPVTRKHLADVVDIPENLVTFHLDRLAEAGVVRVLAAQPGSGRRGRPARRYEVAQDEVSASLPPRRYDVLAEVLALAEREQRDDESFLAAARRVAFGHGRQLGEQALQSMAGGRRSVTQLTWQLFAQLGYEPRRTGRSVVLDNCPFNRLRSTNTPLVCGVNHALAQGYLLGIEADSRLAAELDPTPERCCVVIRTAPAAAAS